MPAGGVDWNLWLPEAGRVALGALGACSYQALRPDPTWRRATLTIGVGTAVAGVGAPWLCDWFGWDGVHAANGSTFTLGFLGYTAAKAILEAVETAGPAWLTRWLGGKVPDPQAPAPAPVPPVQAEVQADKKTT